MAFTDTLIEHEGLLTYTAEQTFSKEKRAHVMVLSENMELDYKSLHTSVT
jgi:hypothetical protein